MSSDEKHTFLDEPKDTAGKFILSKFEHDLFHDDSNVKMPVIRVKHFNVAGKQDRWKIFSDNKVVFILEGIKLNKKERQFLRSLDGINFLISQQKSGIRSFNSLKIALKQTLKKRLDSTPKSH